MLRLATRDGRTLSYGLRGSGPKLICHPGGPGADSLLFQDLGGSDRERTLVLLQPRGTSGSDPPADPGAYRLEDYANDIEELRQHLGLDEVDLFGHSAGGFVAMSYAAAFPKNVRRLVLCGTFTRFTEDWRAEFARFLDERAQDERFADAVAARREREEHPPEDEDELARLWVRSLPLLFGHYGRVEQQFIARVLEAGASFHVPALRYFNEEVAPTFDLRPLLPAIEAVTLVLTGELDVWGAGAAAEMGELVPEAAVVVLEGVGHMPWVEAPDEFRCALRQFL